MLAICSHFRAKSAQFRRHSSCASRAPSVHYCRRCHSGAARTLTARDSQVTLPPLLLALQGAAPAVVPADTAWMLVATALVLLMTPALAFFYGGLVRSKNSLNTMMMSYAALGVVGILWALLAYSLAFADFFFCNAAAT